MPAGFGQASNACWVRLPVVLDEAYGAYANGPTSDHSLLDTLLRNHVDDDGWGDYDGIRADAGDLNKYIRSIADIPFDRMSCDKKLALLINSCNAFTLRLILDHDPVNIDPGYPWTPSRIFAGCTMMGRFIAARWRPALPEAPPSSPVRPFPQLPPLLQMPDD